MKSNCQYTTLDDLEARLDYAVEHGILTEQEAWEELQDAQVQYLYERLYDGTNDGRRTISVLRSNNK
jgi:hypothetical protein